MSMLFPFVAFIRGTLPLEYEIRNLGSKYNNYIFYSVFAIFCGDTLISVGTEGAP